MKMACLVMLIIDLLLFAFAGFRLLTVSKKEINAFENRVAEKAQAYIDASKPKPEKEVSLDDLMSGNTSASEENPFGKDAPEAIAVEGKEPGTESKVTPTPGEPVQVDTENAFDYNDQEVKQESYDEARDKMRNLFPAKKEE